MPQLALPRWADLAVVVLIFLVLPLDFPALQPLRPAVALLVAVWLAIHGREIAGILVRLRLALLLPALALVSALWAVDPLAALRHGALMTFAVLVAAGIAARLDLRQVAIAIALSQGALAIASVVDMTTVWVGGRDGGLAVIGVFPHKNVLGQRMVFLAVAALALLVGKNERAVVRVLSALALGLAVLLIARSLSATAVILLLLAVPIIIGLALIWVPAARVTGLRPALLFGGLAGAFLCLLIAVNIGLSPVDRALGAFGKDRTLTGRTEIWAVGDASIAVHPMLGVGAGSFWRTENNAALQLASRFHVKGANFRFHNAWYEITVHLGLIGLAAGVLAHGRAFWAIFRPLLSGARRGIRLTAPAGPLIIALGSIFLVRSFTESELFYPLVMGPILFWTLAFAALRADQAISAARRQPASIIRWKSAGARP